MQKEWLATFLRSSLIAFIAFSCQKKCEQIAFCIIIALALFSFYLPVKSGLIDGESLLEFNTINLLLGLTLATIAIRFFKHRHKIILILIAGPLIQSSILIMTNLPQTAQSKARLKPGPVSTTQKNVFIMSYDALQSRSVKQAIDALPQKDRDEFDGFTFYEDVLSHGHNTRASNLLTKIGHRYLLVTNISQAKNILPKIHHSAESPMEENQHHAMITDKLKCRL